ncbi:glycerate kinase [Niabella terrae]
MKILVAPNAFKGSLWAGDVAETLREGLLSSELPADIQLVPVGDGGDGTGQLLRSFLQAETLYFEVAGPLGQPLKAAMGWVAASATAIIELADCSGLRHLSPQDYNPIIANTRGLGQLIGFALDKGARSILLGIGGSATIDGGTGLLQALGMVFRDGAGRRLTRLPAELTQLARIDDTGLDHRLPERNITVLCDVKNPLLGGPSGAIQVFGPQKGADTAALEVLTQGLDRFRAVTREFRQVDMNQLPFSGAAGGVAAALSAYAGASAVNGADYMLELLDLKNKIKDAAVVITGEGRIDVQTLEGKAPFCVAAIAKGLGVPVIGVAGQILRDPGDRLDAYFDRLIAINPPGASLTEAMKNTRSNLKEAGRRIGRQLANGWLN